MNGGFADHVKLYQVVSFGAMSLSRNLFPVQPFIW